MQGNSASVGRVLMPENGGMPGDSLMRGTVLMPENGGMPGNSVGGGKSKRIEFTPMERKAMREVLLENCTAGEVGSYIDKNCKFNTEQFAILSATHGISEYRAIRFANNIRKDHPVEKRPLYLRFGRQLKQVY
jgi:hypothetical protein